MATIQFFTKQMETSRKNIVRYLQNVERYKQRTEKACVKAQVNMTDIQEEKRVIGRYVEHEYTIDVAEFELRYRILDNFRYMKENERKVEEERRHLVILAEKIATLQAQQKAEADAFNKGLRKALASSLEDFKKVWMKKMIEWYTAHHEYISSMKEQAKAEHLRVDALYNYFRFRRGHERLAKGLHHRGHSLVLIYTDEAAYYSLDAYLEMIGKRLEESWENKLDTLTKKCQSFNIDEGNISISSPEMTEKGFEVYITDGKPRRVYARLIWAAEYSLIVAPHTRYIVTERTIK